MPGRAGGGGGTKLSLKRRLDELNRPDFGVPGGGDDADKTMQIVLPEDLEMTQTMRISEEDIQVHPEYLADRTMQIEMDQTMKIPMEGLGDREADRTMYLTHLSQEEESERTMMINFANEEAVEEEARVLPSPSESKSLRVARVIRPGESSARESSLPLSMSRADESRQQPMGDPRKRSSTPRTTLGGTSVNLSKAPGMFDWLHRVHPTEGWLMAVLLLPLSGLAFVNVAYTWMLPDHPGPLPLKGSEGFGVNYVLPDVAAAFLIWFMAAMLVQMLFAAAGGRPPLLWTLKITMIALVPFALVRLGWLGLAMLQTGPESFLRGYRPGWMQWMTPGVYGLAGGCSALLLAKAGTGPHCQAESKRALRLFLGIPVICVLGHVALVQAQRWRFEQRVGPAWRRAELAWSESKPEEALPLLEEVLEYGRILTADQKADFYQMRGELRLQAGEVLRAREDFVRAVQLLPPSHAENRLARAANLLAIERVDLAQVQLQIAEEMHPPSANVQRWLAKLALGDFDPGLKNPALALDYARQAVQLDPTAPNRAVLERSEAALRTL